MPKYVIERVVPGASKMTPAELKTMSQRSCNVLNQLGSRARAKNLWVYGHNHDAEFSTKLQYDVNGDGVTDLTIFVQGHVAVAGDFVL